MRATFKDHMRFKIGRVRYVPLTFVTRQRFTLREWLRDAIEWDIKWPMNT